MARTEVWLREGAGHFAKPAIRAKSRRGESRVPAGRPRSLIPPAHQRSWAWRSEIARKRGGARPMSVGGTTVQIDGIAIVRPTSSRASHQFSASSTKRLTNKTYVD